MSSSAAAYRGADTLAMSTGGIIALGICLPLAVIMGIVALVFVTKYRRLLRIQRYFHAHGSAESIDVMGTADREPATDAEPERPFNIEDYMIERDGARFVDTARLPQALPCTDYDAVYGDDPPVTGNLYFRSHAQMRELDGIMERVHRAGSEDESEDYSDSDMQTRDTSVVVYSNSPVTDKDPTGSSRNNNNTKLEPGQSNLRQRSKNASLNGSFNNALLPTPNVYSPKGLHRSNTNPAIIVSPTTKHEKSGYWGKSAVPQKARATDPLHDLTTPVTDNEAGGNTLDNFHFCSPTLPQHSTPQFRFASSNNLPALDSGDSSNNNNNAGNNNKDKKKTRQLPAALSEGPGAVAPAGSHSTNTMPSSGMTDGPPKFPPMGTPVTPLAPEARQMGSAGDEVTSYTPNASWRVGRKKAPALTALRRELASAPAVPPVAQTAQPATQEGGSPQLLVPIKKKKAPEAEEEEEELAPRPSTPRSQSGHFMQSHDTSIIFRSSVPPTPGAARVVPPSLDGQLVGHSPNTPVRQLRPLHGTHRNSFAHTFSEFSTGHDRQSSFHVHDTRHGQGSFDNNSFSLAHSFTNALREMGSENGQQHRSLRSRAPSISNSLHNVISHSFNSRQRATRSTPRGNHVKRTDKRIRKRHVDKGGFVVVGNLEREQRQEGTAGGEGAAATANSESGDGAAAATLSAQSGSLYYYQKIPSYKVYGKGQYLPNPNNNENFLSNYNETIN